MTFASRWSANISASELCQLRLQNLSRIYADDSVGQAEQISLKESIYKRRRQLKSIADPPKYYSNWHQLALRFYRKLADLMPQKTTILSSIRMEHRRVRLLGRKFVRNFPHEYSKTWHMGQPQLAK